MTITAEQRKRRQEGVTGSDAPAIVGASPFKTPLGVWLDKKLDLPPDDPGDVMMLGNILEDYIAQKWTKRTGLSTVEIPGTMVHAQHPFLIGHPDRLVVGREEGLECKLVVWRPDDWGPADSALVPPYVYLQCAHYMMLTGFKRWHVAAQFALRETRCYTVERDDTIIGRLMEWETQFWQMVLDDVRPPMMSPADVDRMFPNDAGTAITADVTIAEALIALRHARAEHDAWKDLKEVLEAQVKGYMAENGVLTDEMGTPLVTWKKSRDGKKFNVDKFRVANPDLYNNFLEPTEGSRRFLIK